MKQYTNITAISSAPVPKIPRQSFDDFDKGIEELLAHSTGGW